MSRIQPVDTLSIGISFYPTKEKKKMAKNRTSNRTDAMAREVDDDFKVAITLRGEANAITAEADRIISSPAPGMAPAQAKATEARTKAGETIGFVDNATTAWEEFLKSPAQSRARDVKIGVGKANNSIQEAQRLLAEARQLKPEELSVKTLDELVKETVQFRIDTEGSSTTVNEKATRVKELHQATPTPHTRTALTNLTSLVSQTSGEVNAAIAAERAVKAATDVAGATPAHANAKAAKMAAEANALSALGQENLAITSVTIIPDPTVTPLKKSLRVAKSNWGIVTIASVVIAVVFFFEYLALEKKLPDGQWYLIPAFIFLVIGGSIVAQMIQEKGLTGKTFAKFVLIQVAFVCVFVALGAFVEPSSKEKQPGGQSTEQPNEPTKDDTPDYILGVVIDNPMETLPTPTPVATPTATSEP